MKKFYCLIQILCIATLISCSNDDDGSIIIDQSLIPGTWNVIAIESNDGRFTGNIQGIESSGSFMAEGKNITTEVVFIKGDNETSNTFSSSGGFTLEISILIPLQDPLVVEEDFPDYLGNGSWRVEGNNLILSVSGEQGNYTVTNLTAQNMSLATSFNEEIDYNGTIFSLDGTLEIDLSKN